MVNKIKNYLDSLFEGAPDTKKVVELKDELFANLIEKYNDLLASGKDQEEAYNIVISGIGDINELIKNLNGYNTQNNEYDDKDRKKNAKLKAIAIMMYIISIVPVLLSGVLWSYGSPIGVVLMFIIAAMATGILVYISASKPRYSKMDETLVEEFKEWKSSKQKNKAVKNSISSVMWTLTVAIYLLVSFNYGNWHYSWIIFIIAFAVDKIIDIIFEIRGK